LILVCGGLLVLCILLALDEPTAALLLAVGLAPLAAWLVWRVHQRVHAMHSHARLEADAAAEAERHYFDVLRGVVQVIEGRDPFLAGRSERIARLVESMARQMGMDESHTRLMTMIAQVHDIGLLAVPTRVLEKPTGLSGGEYRTVQMHSEIGHRILKPLRFLAPVLDAVRHHHERMNGTGYPKELRGEGIPLEARIVAVADAFDAMTHDRPHRRAMTAHDAMGEIIRCAGSGYDANCVTALAQAANLAHLLPAEPTPATAEPGSAINPLPA
jgi:HD-GYP domain-containing protein (c-di-GMP phosphodiesterase class II)